MNSEEFAKYLGATGDYQKPWLLVQLRLQKLAEEKDQLLPSQYMARIADIHQDMMKLGEWWKGQEDWVF